MIITAAGTNFAMVATTFKDAAADDLLRQLFFGSTIVDWEITIPDFGTVTGQVQITALEYGGAHDGEVTFEMALESAGSLTFVAAV